MKLLLHFILVSVLLLGATSALSKEKVVVYGDTSYPPYSYLDEATNTPMGIYVEVLRAAFAEMPDYEVTIELVPWKNGLNKVEKGTGLALFPPYENPERDPWLSLSEPILPETVIVFGTEEKLKDKVKWPEDFTGTTIGLNAGFSPRSMGGEAFEEAIKKGKISIDDQGKSNDTSLKKLAAGRIDFYLNDRRIDISAFPNVRRSDIVANQSYGYLGFTKNTEKFPYLDDFKAKFDAVLKELKAAGVVDKILRQHQ